MEKGRLLQWHKKMDSPHGQAGGSPQRPALGDVAVPGAEGGEGAQSRRGLAGKA